MSEYRIIRIDNENGVIGNKLVNTTGQTITFSGITLSNGNILTGVDSFITGATMNGNSLELSRNQGLGLLSVNMSQFVDDTNSYVTGGTVSGTDLVLGRNGGLSDVTIDTSAYFDDTNQWVSGATFNNSSNTITLLGAGGLSNSTVILDITTLNDLIINGNLTVTGNTLSDVFSGNTTNAVFYGDGSNLTGVSSVDSYVTGFTYNNINQLTLNRNSGLSDLTTVIDTFSGLTVDNYIDFGTTNNNPTPLSGRTFFDINENALSYFPETPSMDVTINLGQESVIRVHNDTGALIPNGAACHISGVDLDNDAAGIPTVVLAIASGVTSISDTSYEVSGIATHDIPDSTNGFITAFGVVRDLNITGVVEGADIWLSDTVPGGFIYSISSLPNTSRVSKIGHVITTGTTDAKILVEITNEQTLTLISAKEAEVIAVNDTSTGLRDGGLISINGSDATLFDISAGAGVVVDNTTDSTNPTLTEVSWGIMTGNSVTISGNPATFIMMDVNGDVFTKPSLTPPDGSDYRSNIFLGLVGHAKTTIEQVFNYPTQLTSPVNQLGDLANAIGPFSLSGNKLSGIGGTLSLLKTSGRSYFNGANFQNDKTNPSIFTTPELSGVTLVWAKQDLIYGLSGSSVDIDRYDLNGVLTPIAVNDWGTHRVWHQPDNNILTFQFSQYTYNNLANAKDGLSSEVYVVPPPLSTVSYLLGVVIAQQGELNLDTATFIPQGKFAGTGGGGGGSVDTLQTAYSNSSQPEIITDSTRNGIDIRVGSGSDTDKLISFQNTASNVTAYITGEGYISGSTVDGTNLYENGTNINTIYNTISQFNVHTGLTSNPHQVTTTQIGALKNTTDTLNGDLTVTGNTLSDVFSGSTTEAVFYGDGSNLTGIKTTSIITANENLVSGDLVYLDTSGWYTKSDNTSDVTSSTELRIVTETITSGSTGSALVEGKYVTTGLSTGSKYWVSTGGTYTDIQPSTDGVIVRYIGTALSSTILEFNPDELYIEISSSSNTNLDNTGLRNVSITTSVLATDYSLNCTNTITITLPSAINRQGKIYNIKNSGTGVITIDTTSSQTIDGGLTAVLNVQYESLTLQSDGSNWIII